jgi:malto-oligosyltrehalose trehalohydrolase
MSHAVRRFGATPSPSGTTFRLWAPAASSVELVINDTRFDMTQLPKGWFATTVASARAGTRYHFRIDGELDIADPASLYQPEDVAGPSEVTDHDAFRWRTKDWRGRPWHEAIFLECHVGAFSPAGTFRGMAERLDHIADTGLTAIELMPVADFPGRRNWGYDGVLWYAPDHSYGTPDDLKHLIDEAHLRGIMVFLDVVYNHFGPEENHLPRYAPQFFCDTATPWGAAIDYSVPEVRAFAIDNAIVWLRDYRFDGLRLDAVHAIAEPGGLTLLEDLSSAVGALAQASGRHLHLVLENDDNRSSLLDPATAVPSGKYRAQWNDDYHHAWHVLLTGETQGYYADYASAPEQMIARMLRAGFAYQGEPSRHRGGRPRGESTQSLPPTAFVNFLQNHDQIGNRALGDRLEWSAGADAIEAALAVTLLAPMPPLLFMGEEWGARTPFPFFCDFHGELADAIRHGRRKEFVDAYAAFGDDVPDPLSPATFEAAKLDWSSTDTRRYQLVKRLLAIRAAEIIPRLSAASFAQAECDPDGLLTACWNLADRAILRLSANLSESARRIAPPRGRIIWGDATEPARPWSVLWTLGEDR